MRLHSLRLEGIGPFHGEQVIDFRVFDASGLFLLEGPTGAGKSTLIDAISFALYGDVARQQDSDKARLRSSYCAPTDPSSVELAFEVPAGIFRVRRTPSFTRPGRKAPVNTTVHLERLAEADDGQLVSVQVLSRSIAEADAEIRSLVGLSKDQFLQTVVLPQGKFSRFLTSTSKDRADILRDVFGAGLYFQLQEALRQRASQAQRMVDRAEVDVRQSWAVFDRLSRDAVEKAEPDASLEALTPAEMLTVGAHRLDALAALVSQAQAAVEPAKAHSVECARALEDGRSLARARRDYIDASKRMEHLKTQVPEMRRLAVQVEESRRVASVVRLCDRAAQARSSESDGRSQALAACAEVSQALPPTGLTWSAPGDLTEIDAVSHSLDRLDQQVQSDAAQIALAQHLVADLAKHRRDAKSLATDMDTAAHKLREAQEKAVALPHKREQTSAIRDQQQQIAATAPHLQERIDALTPRLAAAIRTETLAKDHEKAKDTVSDCVAAARTAAAAAKTLHEAWLSDAARALSTTLTKDQPCPVCGSPNHPAPAHTTAPNGISEAVTREEVAAADARKEEADRAVEKAQSALASITAALEAAHAVAGHARATLEADLSDAQAQLHDAKEAAEEVRKLSSTLVELEVEQQNLSTEIASLEAQVASIAATRDSLEAAAAAAEQSLAQMGLTGIEVEARAQALTDLARLVDEARHRLDTLIHAIEYAAQAEADRAEALAAAGLPSELADETQLRARLMSDAEMEQAVKAIEAHAAELASMGGRRTAAAQALGVDAAGDAPLPDEPDLEALEAAASQAAEALSEAIAQRQQSSSSHNDAVEAFEELTTQVHSVERATADAAPIRRLAALAMASGPENLQQTPLGTWVLLSRFEEVLAAANPRLLAISDGRYELLRVADDGTRSRKSGLGLAVVDHDTEETRPTRTLSGGETFYTSLALALGLADVVTAEAGGIELRTMFIDEGFGSLDAAKLDIVMTQLAALRDHGRTVGVISHVDELSRRIPDQINVRWTQAKGSTVHIRA